MNFGIIENCTNKGNITNLYSGGNYIAGIAGLMMNSYIEDCSNEGIITSTNCSDCNTAGIVGRSLQAKIVNCRNNGEIKGKQFTGGIVGYLMLENLDGCTNTGNVTGTEYVGGISGFSSSSDNSIGCKNYGTITGTIRVAGIFGMNCYSHIVDGINYGTIIGTNVVGGICGGSQGSVEKMSRVTNCRNEGNVSATTDNLGGISGNTLNATIVACGNVGVIVGPNDTGGIIGFQGGAQEVYMCYNRGNVTGTGGGAKVGGMIGAHTQTSTMIGSYNTGTIASPYRYGGIIGRLTSGAITTYSRNYYKTGTAPTAISYESAALNKDIANQAEPMADVDMKTQTFVDTLNASLTSLNLDYEWQIVEGENDGYPIPVKKGN